MPRLIVLDMKVLFEAREKGDIIIKVCCEWYSYCKGIIDCMGSYECGVEGRKELMRDTKFEESCSL